MAKKRNTVTTVAPKKRTKKEVKQEKKQVKKAAKQQKKDIKTNKKEAKKEKKYAKQDAKEAKKREKFAKEPVIPLENLGRDPGKVTCPACGITACTSIKKKTGCVSCMFSFVFDLLCALNPIPIPSLTNYAPKPVKHHCSACDTYLAIKPRMGKAKISRTSSNLAQMRSKTQ